MNEYMCPTCGCCNEVANWQETFTCACGLSWRIIVDAEFVDGAWRDLSAIIPCRSEEEFKTSQTLDASQVPA